VVSSSIPASYLHPPRPLITQLLPSSLRVVLVGSTHVLDIMEGKWSNGNDATAASIPILPRFHSLIMATRLKRDMKSTTHGSSGSRSGSVIHAISSQPPFWGVTHWMYDTDVSSTHWNEVAPPPSSRAKAACVVARGELWLIGE
jgi:hypothetical protein